MKIQSLKVRGAIGYKKGMGVDDIDLDFSGLSGLVALSGQNGAGKTTTLELLSPYRMLASRDGSMRHHFCLRDSFRDLTFLYGADQYRTLLKVDSESDRTEGFIWKNGESQVNGKVTAYDQYITRLLGSSNLFYNSVFCAQNATKLSDMRTGQLKELFVEFLRLDRLSGYESSAKQCVTVLAGRIQQIEQEIKTLKDQYKSFEDLDCQIETAETERNEFQANITMLGVEIQKIDKQIKILEEVQTRNAINIERKEEIQTDLDSQKKRIIDKYHQHTLEIEQLQKTGVEKSEAIAVHQKKLLEKDAILNAAEKVKELEGKLAASQRDYAEQVKIIDAVYADERVKLEKITEYQAEIDRLENNIGLKNLENTVDTLNTEKSETQTEMDRLARVKEEAEVSFEVLGINQEIKTCKETMSLLEKRDPECTSKTCSFIVSAIEAEKNIPLLKEKKRKLVEEITQKVVEIDSQITAQRTRHEQASVKLEFTAKEYRTFKAEIKKKIAFIKSKKEIEEVEQKNTQEHISKDLIANRDSIETSINSLTSEIENTRILSGKLSEIENTEFSIKNLNKERFELDQRIDGKKDTYSKANIEHRAHIRRLERKLEEIEALIDTDAVYKISELTGNLSSTEIQKESFEKDLKKSEEWIVLLTGRKIRKAEIEKKISSAEKELGFLSAESAQWLYLQNGCGKNGLQALEIDGVAPLVTGYANDLLTSSFGPGFSVRIVTQDPETGKETFDIMVIRGDGSETSFKKLSGGEKVWILKSIRLAMTLVSKEKSERNFQTLYCDEEDGPLDTEKAQSFIGLYKSILDVGGFDTCFYISHNSDVVSMSDHRIEFTGNGIVIN